MAFPFCHDSLKVVIARKPKQLLFIGFDTIGSPRLTVLQRSSMIASNQHESCLHSQIQLPAVSYSTMRPTRTV
jgi:hypothetical protein